MPPTAILPGHTYVHVTSNLSPKAISDSLTSSSPNLKLEYRGPVGELEGEHIFEATQPGAEEVVEPEGSLWKRDGEPLLHAVRAVKGVEAAQVLVSRQRAKREEL